MQEPFTNREQEILLLIGQGLTNKEIAARLFLSPGTVKAHTHNIYSKLNVANRTQALIKAEQLGLLANTGIAATGEAVIADSPPSNNLPQQLTPFIGRKSELARLAGMLADERIRLITILGGGGMGKTRLAIEVARQSAAAFKDGTFFVSLARVSDTRHLASAIIDDLGLRLQISENPQQQLLSYLQSKHVLLILDNFEQLVAGADLIAELLQTAADVKLLVTSRERLNLSAEVVFVLQGLSYDADHASMEHDAVQLLLERIHVVNPSFALQPEDWSSIQRICQLTQGMPLGLILATGWLDMLTLTEIADELARSIDILESQLRDLPTRQRSMRATITLSWNRLTEQEQTIFASLSVFRGGFTREAAQKVAGATLRELQTLVNRSFITFQDGRYQMHELLRQFAEAELRQSPEQYQHIHDLHCNYFTNFLHERLQDVDHTRKRIVISEITLDLDNIRAAWWWAVDNVKLDEMQQAVETMASFWHTQGRYIEGIEIFGSALQGLNNVAVSEKRDLLIAIMSTDLGWYHIRLGRLDEAETLFRRGYAIFEQLGFPFLISNTDPLIGLALLASIRGNYDEATRIAEQALQQNTVRQHLRNQAYALYALTGIKLAQGHYDQAFDYGQQAVATADSENSRDQWLVAYCLIELGNIARAVGDDDTARRYYQASYQIKEEFEDPEGMAVVLNHLGQLALRQNDFEEAERLYQQSLRIYTDIQDQGGLATTLHGLGQVALGLKNYSACRVYLRRALHVVSQIEYAALVFAIMFTFAELELQLERPEESFSLLAFIQQHPSASQETKNQAMQMLTHHQKHTPASIGDNTKFMSASGLAEVIAAVQAELSKPS